ncbi:cytochrome P450 [Paraphoma chrysanthemicola]|nr:cytochrome P450 [Paraphoma chrysanthemicola]
MNLLLKGISSADLKRQDVFLSGVVILSCGFLMLAIHQFLLHPLRHVPGPFVAKISDSYMFMSKIHLNRAHAFRDLHNTYGSLVRIGPNEVSIADWRMYRKIYRDRCILKDPNFYSPFEFLGEGNVFATCDTDDHAARKKLMGPAFSFQQVNCSTDVIIERTDAMVDCIVREAYKSSIRTVDVFHLLGVWSVEVICKVMFNTQFSANEAQISTILKAMEKQASL